MKPYFDDGHGIVLYHADCRDVLPTLAAGSVDCVVTDPPWKASDGSRVNNQPGKVSGVAICRGSNSLAYGSIGVFDSDLLASCLNLAAADVLVLCGYIELGEVIAAIGATRGIFVWHNPRPVPLPGPVAQRDVAFIVWGGRTTTVKDGRRFRSCLFSHPSPQAGCMAVERILNADGTTAHPAQEPIRLFIDLTNPLRGTILDPYCGTGTTLLAAKLNGQNSIGIEIEERYCEIAARRLSQAVLWPAEPKPKPQVQMTLEEARP
jgi:site-specific DNA-methyltransferase (adenine-specific)